MDCRGCGDVSWIQQWISDVVKPTAAKTTRPQPSASSTAPGSPGLHVPVRDPATFKCRELEKLKELVVSWESFVHPRAREFFPSQETLISVLTEIARSVPEDADPILGGDSACCFWYGELSTPSSVPSQAVLRLLKPGETSESVTFVNRVLVFIFATDDSFEQLMKLPKEPFRTVCGDQLCVNLNHISTSL